MVESTSEMSWYCLRSHPKQETVAFSHLSIIPGIDLFFPRLRIKKTNRRISLWITEPLFPSYLFVRFSPRRSLLRLRHTPGIQEVVKFGDTYPIIPDESILNLRSRFRNDITVVEQSIQTGDNVIVTQGAFKGLDAKVIQFLPAKQRAKILLLFLGQLSAVEVPDSHIGKEAVHPLAA